MYGTDGQKLNAGDMMRHTSYQFIVVFCVLSGECVFALKSAFAAQPQPFNTVLTHVGEETGTIRLFFHMFFM